MCVVGYISVETIGVRTFPNYEAISPHKLKWLSGVKVRITVWARKLVAMVGSGGCVVSLSVFTTIKRHICVWQHNTPPGIITYHYMKSMYDKNAVLTSQYNHQKIRKSFAVHSCDKNAFLQQEHVCLYLIPDAMPLSIPTSWITGNCPSFCCKTMNRDRIILTFYYQTFSF